ncbi:LppU/SCO3897 family protein [Actinomadura citrea]|uniref:Uncharacterized protein n=1 Tax=Actinomadura citrea TaxID=46158 RepID=A0A7Y9GIC8_9ACTN|nr:hypothetical protein [Actinomadura citrea]NYE17027.1 hypothetical protein [Actinomadura citrea]GGT59677.1 hypothetical protein GCM10010177_15340 [Actinomadura citrea]
MGVVAVYGQVPEGQGQAQGHGQGRPPMSGPPMSGPPMPGPFQPAGPQGPPPVKRPSPIVWAAVAVAGVVVLAGVAFLALHGTGAPTGPVKAEQCVDTGFGMDDGKRIPPSLRVSCDDAEAKAKVVKVVGKKEASAFQFGSRAEPDCPSGTDGFTNVRAEKEDKTYYEACVRNLKGSHPGDPGAGGAFLSAGDCVSSGSIGFGKEQPCSEPDWYGKLIARVGAESACPAKTLETMKMRSFGGGNVADPVLCLGAGGGVLSPGDCIEDPSFNVGDLDKAQCESSDAIAKVVGRVATTKECPAEATDYMTSEGSFRPVLCLKKLRPTLTEKLRSLPG